MPPLWRERGADLVVDGHTGTQICDASSEDEAVRGVKRLPGRIDHDHDDEPKGDRDPVRAELAAALGVRDDRAASGEDERERRECLGEAAPSE